MRPDNRGGFAPRNIPVDIGDELNVKIEGVGEKGDGIAKKDGFVLFVPNTQQGQDVKIRVTKVLKSVGFAEVVGDADAPVESEQPPQEEESREVAEEPAPQEEEQNYEDTEDFGEEESSEEPAEEAPQDESEEEKKE